jgi:hypothetical protein
LEKQARKARHKTVVENGVAFDILAFQALPRLSKNPGLR